MGDSVTYDDDDDDAGDAALRDLLDMRPRTAPARPAPGQTIGETFRVERMLGAGGMGVVYLARDVRLRRDVAIKIHSMLSSQGGERLLREAAALAQLVHPNVVTVYEVGEWRKHPYVAMEYVRGGTARSWLADAPRGRHEILRLYLAAGRGLAAAHAAGLVHRDFKPDNVLVGDDGRIRVADFGLARGFDDAADAVAAGGDEHDALPVLTATGAVMGTPAYMAPEQQTSAPVGPAADQFAFAVAVWEALAGERPFHGETAAERAAAIAAGRLREPPAGRIPAHVHRTLTRALAVSPDARFPSMEALLVELARDPAARRRRLAIGAAAVVAVAGLGAGATWLAAERHTPAAATCEASDELAGVWDDARKAALRDALPPETYARVAPSLDDYAAAWVAQRTEACAATQVRHEQTFAELALREACLDRRRDTLRTVIDVCTDPAVGDGAVTALEALDGLDECTDIARLAGSQPLPDDPAERAAITAARGLLDEARALYLAGRLAPALAKAELAVAGTEQLGNAWLEGEAAYWLGTIQMTLPHGPASARATLERSAQRASEAHDDGTTALAWITVVKLLGEVEHDLDGASKLVPVAEAAVARAGNTSNLDASFSTVIGELRRQQGRFTEARSALEHAIALFEADGRGGSLLATPLRSLGGTLQALGDVEGARAALQRAIDIIVADHGPDNAFLAAPLSDLAWLDVAARRFADAVVELERELAVEEGFLGPDHEQIAITLLNLAQILLEVGRDADALERARRAVAVIERHVGDDDPELVDYLATCATAYANTGDTAHALADFDRALLLAERPPGSDDVQVARILLGRALVRADAGKRSGALADLARARAIAARHPEDAALSGEIAAAAAIDAR